MSFWAELKRRNVFRVAAAYLVASWLVVQVVGQLTAPLALPDSLATVVVVLLGIGFPIALIVAWIYEVTPEGVRATADLDAAQSGATRSTQRLNYVIVALLVAAVGLMAIDTFLPNDASIPEDPVAGADDASAAGTGPRDTANATEDGEPAGEPTLTLAVLPFDDASQNGDQAYLADGIAREIRNVLSLVDGLSVIGHDTSQFFDDQNADLRSLRDDWGVQYILEGSVRSANERLRIDVTLTDTDTGTIAYNETHERMLDDSFSLLDEVAESAARAMEVTLGVGAIGGRLGMTRNAEAFEEYLQAQAIVALAVDGIRRSIAHYERAVALDDTFSLAWFGLFSASATLDTFLSPQGGDPAARVRADEALSRVTELTPDLPELVLAALASAVDPAANHDFFELGRIIDEFSRSAAERDYPFAQIGNAQAMFLFATGRIDSAVALLERVRAIDPFNRVTVNALAEGYAAQGRPQASFGIVREYVDQTGQSAFEMLARSVYTALETGDEELINERLTLWRTLENPQGANLLYQRMAQLLDEPEQALEEIEAFAESQNAGLFMALNAAPWAAYFGGDELALDVLAGADLQSIAMSIARPLFSDVRRTDGFKEFVRSIGLEAYWRETGNWGDYCRPVGLDDLECF